MVKIQKTFSLVLILAGSAGFSSFCQAANAPDAVRYISNRIKIVRPQTPEPVAPALVSTPAPDEKEINAAVQSEQASPEDKGPVDLSSTGEKSETAIKAEVAALLGKKEQFYTRRGRIDPFEPFLRKPEPEVVSAEDELLKRRVPRTPLEKIDLSQLRLTGVLRTPTKTKALVQDSSGKGYIVDEGTYVGNKGGQVARILKDRVVVEEKYLDVFGKIALRERELKLQP